MDEICAFGSDCLAWLEKAPLPKILFAGSTPILRFSNPSAPHLEVSFFERGSVEGLRLGDRLFDVPEGWATLHTVHFGNHSPDKPVTGRAWCFLLDASHAPPALRARFAREPVFSAAPIENPGELIDAFGRLRRACLRQGRSPTDYDPGLAMFDPSQPGCSAACIAKVKASFLEILAILCEQGGASGDPAPVGPVERVLTALEARYDDAGLTLPELASAAGLSLDHFGRVFKARTGTSPMAYVRRLRLREAALMLRQTGHRIEEIAAAVGYGDPLYFSRLFSREFGVGPRGYRKRGG